MIKALVFDFDGTILDTEWTLYEAFREIYEQHGVILPKDKWSEGVGRELVFDPFLHLEELTGKQVDRIEMEKLWLDRHHELLKSKDIRPGVRDYLEAGKNLGLQIGVASSSPKSWVLPFLETYQIRDYFTCICTKDDVQKVKPDPELYLKVIDCMGVEAKDTIAFEDSMAGAQAAKSAGLHCVITPHELTRNHPFTTFDVRLESLAERKLEQLLEGFRE
ncbi:HAD family hydrolase [Brevibacillus daliensis]|uniref:HAD family hydrolase n=1 Tax=Brevibacillus daliensis TaxID=2892995 RepID=UPI001E5B837F|nr:HAD-IA family hydrolase [Brevibacillus daliensis]